jgi:hypothetical protein
MFGGSVWLMDNYLNVLSNEFEAGPGFQSLTNLGMNQAPLAIHSSTGLPINRFSQQTCIAELRLLKAALSHTSSVAALLSE